MGSALVGGIVESGICDGADCYLYDPHVASAERLADTISGNILSSNADIVVQSDVILVCVKPQGFLETMDELGE